jgi:hypothetical protein
MIVKLSVAKLVDCALAPGAEEAKAAQILEVSLVYQKFWNRQYKRRCRSNSQFGR